MLNDLISPLLRLWRGTRRSARICGVMCFSIGWMALLAWSGALQGDDPDSGVVASILLFPLFYPFYIITMFAIVPAVWAIFCGVRELRAGGGNVQSIIAIAVSVLVALGYLVLLSRLWPALMGV